MTTKFRFAMVVLGLGLACAPAALQAQEDEAPSGLPVKYALQFADARHDYNVGNLRGALTTYRDLLDELPDDARVMLWIARCHAGLRREDLALTYLDKVADADADLANEEQRFRGRYCMRLGGMRRRLRRLRCTWISTSLLARRAKRWSAL